jgi:hypothetical protein
MSCGGFQGLSMTSRGSRRLLLSGNELRELGRREAPLFVQVEMELLRRNSSLRPIKGSAIGGEVEEVSVTHNVHSKAGRAGS